MIISLKILSGVALTSLAIVFLNYRFESNYDTFINVTTSSGLSENLVVDSPIEKDENKINHQDNKFSRSMISVPNRSDDFQIMSTEKLTGTNIDLCLQAKSLSSGSKIILRDCSSSQIKQKWVIDPNNKIHTKGDDNLCIAKAKRANIFLQLCTATKTNRFIINAVEDTINFRNNGLRVFSIGGDEPLKGKPLKLQKRKNSKKMQNWITVPTDLLASSDDIPNEFQIVSDENSNCIEPTSLSNGSFLNLNTCDKANDAQKWSINLSGVIRNIADTTKCIVRDSADLKLGSCVKSNLNMFMFDAFDSTLVLKRSGGKAFTVVGNIVKIATKTAFNTAQQWIMTSDSGGSVGEIEYIGNPCTDYSDGGKCTQCQGDCDTDSDCEGNLRCAQRKESSGVENVPGCTWGSASNRFDDTDYCFLPTSEPGVINYVGECGSGYLCGECEGDCDDDGDCEGDLICVSRSGYSAVQGCTGEGGDRDLYGKDICAPNPTPTPPTPPTPATPAPTEDIVEINNIGNPCTAFFNNGKCTECSGDCDTDSDCEGNLRCAQRRESSGVENVPGCTWGSASNRFDDTDYCFLPTSEPGVINYVGECGSGYLCGECEGDCDNDGDCEGDLICVSRSGYSAVQGCTGEGGDRDLYGKDICAPNPTPTPPTPTPPTPTIDYLNSLEYIANGCTSVNPCSKCQGPCNGSSTCDAGLTCFTRDATEPVPGCVTGSVGDVSGADYCYEDPGDGLPTYIPGQLSKVENGLRLSTGLTARIIATTGNKVTYTGPNGGQSSAAFHIDPDAGAVFPDSSVSNPDGWIYVSNSEESTGGVGAITFNSDGNVIDYEMVLEGTRQNCGGGKTYWGTWVSCEENGSSGLVWEVNPALSANQQKSTPTSIVTIGGNYESFAYDARDRLNPTFYVTEDSSDGALTRFTPNADVVAQAEQSGDYSSVLHTAGTQEWLVLNPVVGDVSGTFSWTSTKSVANSNAYTYYPYTEGIDVRNGMLYFVSKTRKSLYILDLDNLTYTRSSTISGAFDGQPDQVKRIIAEDPDSDMLYFCEEAGADNGIHARDSEGNFYTIIDATSAVSSETTGLAFSPDNKHMYISYQGNGLIYDISREDGYPFGAHRLDIKYHAE